MNESELVALLSRSFLFRDLSARELELVLTAARLRTVARSEFYFQQGDPATTLYVLASGEARMLQLTPEGNQVLFGFLAPGDMFGGVAFLGHRQYPVSVEAVQPCSAAGWDGEVMADLMERHPRIALNAMQQMSDRIQELQDRLRELATERVERRVANTLLRLAQQTGQKTPNGVLLNLPLTREDIANMTGTTLYTVSRILSGWEQKGIVESARERIVIRSPHDLVSIAHDLPLSSPHSANPE